MDSREETWKSTAILQEAVYYWSTIESGSVFSFEEVAFKMLFMWAFTLQCFKNRAASLLGEEFFPVLTWHLIIHINKLHSTILLSASLWQSERKADPVRRGLFNLNLASQAVLKSCSLCSDWQTRNQTIQFRYFLTYKRKFFLQQISF